MTYLATTGPRARPRSGARQTGRRVDAWLGRPPGRLAELPRPIGELRQATLRTVTKVMLQGADLGHPPRKMRDTMKLIAQPSATRTSSVRAAGARIVCAIS